MSTTNDDALISAAMRPIVAFAVIMVFSTQNIVRHTDTVMLTISGVLTAFGLMLLILDLLDDGPSDRSKTNKIVAMLIAGSAGFCITMAFATQTAARLDHQCGLLEIDMMKLRPARKDSRDLFQALQCRPQNKGTLWFPAGHGFS